MATLTVTFIPLITVPSDGYIVSYRVKGSTGGYTILTPHPTTSPAVITGLLPATEYEGTIGAHCTSGYGVLATFSTCTCAAGYTAVDDNGFCQKIETASPTVIHSDYCLAGVYNAVYTQFYTRIYNPGFANSSIGIAPAPAPEVYAELTTANVWVNAGAYIGPMNSAAVWIDSNCDGVRDSLTVGAQTTVAAIFNNTGVTRTIYIGVGGDNQFILKVNSLIVAQTTLSGSDRNFKIWHVFPVVVNPGINDINVVATGDGSTNDAIAMTIYDNTAVELLAATTLADLNVAFSTESLIGTHIDIATCATGYSLDTSGGVGFYVCRKITNAACGGA